MKASMHTLYFFSCRFNDLLSSKQSASLTLVAVGNKADWVDADKLAELLQCGQLKPVYHGMPGVRLLDELVHSYDSRVSHTTREMNREEAIYWGRAIGRAARNVYYQRNREQWLEKLTESGVRQRADHVKD